MTLPPADWYDDPENPLKYRYWDGQNWTDHRSPKAPPAPPGARSGESAWGIVGQIFGLLSNTWRSAVIVTIPFVLATFAGAALIYLSIDNAINIDPSEFVDRISRPGFDPTSGEDELFIDSIEFSIDAGVVATMAAGALIWWLGAMASALALLRLFMAELRGPFSMPGVALLGGIRRVPRLVLLTIQVALGAIIVAIVMTIVAAVSPLLVLVVLPAALALVLWLTPYLVTATCAAALGPRGQSPISTARTALSGRWRFVMVRLLVIILLSVGISIPFGMVSNGILSISLWGYLMFSTLVQAGQVIVGQAGYALIYERLGAPVDPELSTPPQ